MEEGLPVMFTLLHPLDDVSPVVCRYPSTGEIVCKFCFVSMTLPYFEVNFQVI